MSRFNSAGGTMGQRISDKVDIHPVIMQVSANRNDPARNAIQQRLGSLMQVLQASGFQDLQALGTMQLGGSLLVGRGITLAPEVKKVLADTAAANSGRGIGQTRRLVPAKPWMSTTPKQARTSGTVISQNDAFWAAEEIHIPDNTSLELIDGQISLVLLARKVVLGKNVTITYKRQDLVVPTKPPAPSSLGAPGHVDNGTGTAGVPGYRGTDGAHATNMPAHAPRVEIWSLELEGTLACDLRGQDGFPGGEGGNGGAGQPGGKGANAKSGGGSGAMSGGNGGAGGRGGDGGRGSDGANGGEFVLYAPGPVLTSVGASGFSIQISGGVPGVGGRAGKGGPGGAGGAAGDRRKYKMGDAAEYPGSTGANGADGVDGPPGNSGQLASSTPSRFVPISSDDFTQQMLLPRIAKIVNGTPVVAGVPHSARPGQQIQVEGQNFTSTDRLEVDTPTTDYPCSSTFTSSNRVLATVPEAGCGIHQVVPVQADGSRGIPATIHIYPEVSQSMKSMRLRPGTTVTLQGRGLGSKTIVELQLFRTRAEAESGTGSPVASQMQQVISTSATPTSVQFVLTRPTTSALNLVESAASGEWARLVVRAQGLGNFVDAKSWVPIVLDTYHILVLGDSIMWNVGLEDTQKHHYHVAEALRPRHAGIGVYRSVFAHTGAIIGIGKANINKFHGELPYDFPTIYQQVDAAAAQYGEAAKEVDLVLLNGGINDMGLTKIVRTPNWKDAFAWHSNEIKEQVQEIESDIVRYMHDDMKLLLRHAATKFPKAKFLIVGYNLFIGPGFDNSLNVFREVFTQWVASTAFGELDFNKEAAFNKCLLFVTKSEFEFKRCVDELNTELSPTANRFAFVSPNKSSTNPGGLEASNALYDSGDPALFELPVNDPTEIKRSELIEEAGDTYLDAVTAPTKAYAKRASMGHPNLFGAAKYSAAIDNALRALGW